MIAASHKSESLRDAIGRYLCVRFVEGFRPSRNDNLWRDYDDYRLTVFKFKDRYKWCAADDYGPRFSDGSFATTLEAIEDLWMSLTECEL